MSQVHFQSTNSSNLLLLLMQLQVSITTDDTARRSIVDHTVHKECSDKSLKTMMEICIRCLSSEPTDRPSVEDVLWNLQFAAQVQDSWRGDTQNNED
ncbi:probable inactive leucine-rich repeat receptor-like protein kinase At3g03770 [Fagus crenata]